MNIQVTGDNGQITSKDLQFRQELANLLNRYSKENGSDTPDFILANYLERCLKTFDITLSEREAWWGRPIGVEKEAQ